MKEGDEEKDGYEQIEDEEEDPQIAAFQFE